MGFRFWKLISGINLVPKTPGTASEMGDLEVDSATGRLLYHDGTSASAVITSASTDITILTPPLKFQETGGGTDIISMTAPASVSASYTFKLPPNAGTLDYVLRTDGAGATSWTPPTTDATPTGVITMFAGSAAPSGWKLCSGAEYDPALEPNLFAVIGTTYNTGGETPGWFRTPDLRGRLGAGKDDMGGTAANRITNAGSGIVGTTLGASGGAENHTLTSAEIPSHTHVQDAHSHGTGTLANATSAISGTVGGSDGTHTHTFTSGTESAPHTHSGTTVLDGGYNVPFSNGDAGAGFEDTTDAGGTYLTAPNHQHTFTTGTESAPHTHSGTTNTTGSGHSHAHALTAAAQALSGSTASVVATNQNTGGGTAHLNMQPTMILNYIIKA